MSVERVWPSVFQRVYNRLRRWGLQPADAEDVASEATLFAAERARAQEFVSEEHCENWMYLVAVRRAIDLLRARGRTLPQPLVEDLLASPSLEPSGWEGIVSRCEQRLTPRQRQLLSLHYRDGLTLRELADVLLPPDDRSLNGRITAIRREREQALEQLRRGLEEEGLDPDEW